MLLRQRPSASSSAASDGLPMSHGGYYASSGGSSGSSYSGYYGGGGSSYGSGDKIQNFYFLGRGGSKGSSFDTFQILKICIGATLLWSVIIGSWYWNLRSSLTALLSHIPEDANPINSKIIGNIPNFIDMYLQDLQAQVESAKGSVTQSQKDQQRRYQQQLNQLERENRFLQKERDELRVKYEGPDKVEELARMQLREQAFQEQVELLQEATRKESKRTVEERFGSGPHYVKMFFEINGQPEADFLIQMAPLDAVPHAVHLFLEQVDHGLWNNSAYFYLNGPHVVQGGPALEEEFVEDDSSGGEEHKKPSTINAHEPFEEMGLDELAFPDYSHDFPHVTWTLGYTGRPGGPDFYINKVDNTEDHGPGGQDQHVLEEQGDACFGKIVEGQQAVTRIFTQAVYNDGSDWQYFMKDPVKITGAVVWTQGLSNNNKDTGSNENRNGSKNPEELVDKINEKLKRLPRLPKIDHAVEP